MVIDSRTYNILVVEDNPGDFTLVEDFLFEQIVAPHITHVTTYLAATEICARNVFDVILLDLSLPDRTGEALIREMLDVCGNAPVIVLTGYSDVAFGLVSLSLGVSDYILKDELTPISLYKSIIYCIERKKHSNELDQSEKRYSELFNFSPLPMWVIDLDTLQFLDVNNATINQYGFSREEFLSMTLEDLRPIDEAVHLEFEVANSRQNPDVNSRKIMIHKKKNGDLMNVEIQIAPIRYKGINANVVIATDITERLNYIKAVESQNERLREISWIQSHVVRAPLTRIMGLIPLLENICKSQEEKEKVLEYILLSANELDEIIATITDKSKIEDFTGLLNKYNTGP